MSVAAQAVRHVGAKALFFSVYRLSLFVILTALGAEIYGNSVIMSLDKRRVRLYTPTKPIKTIDFIGAHIMMYYPEEVDNREQA